ncbi:MAG TPA: hypothetical protein VE404_00745, partial [Verrucomicrobiae bacterium]|nr:hypothetical protein [Verrucomicrobiae bacterium]
TFAAAVVIAATLMLFAGSPPARAESPPGDGHTVLLVKSLGDDEITCARPAPSIRWTLAGFNRFRVLVGTDPDFGSPITSGSMLLSRSTWSIPATKWASLCRSAPTHLYIKVTGTVAESGRVARNDVVALRTK